MKRIKLVISDCHLGNGRYRPDGSVNLLEDFQHDEELIDFVRYHGSPPEEQDVELVINGDFFNMIQLLPEEQEQGILTERAAIAKVEAIIQGHAEVFAALHEFNSRPNRRLVFILGNHDPQLIWRGVQEIIIRTIQGEVRFIEDVYRFDGVHIEHGHELEPIFRMQKDRYFLTKNTREPLLNLPWGVFFVKDYLYQIKRRRPFVDKVTPYRLFLRWCLFNDFFFFWWAVFAYLWFVVKSRFSELPLKRAGAFKGFGAVFSLARAATLASQVAGIIERERCRIVILGHTHNPAHINIGGGEYLNLGSWNAITHLDLANLGHTRRLIYVLIEVKQGQATARLLEWYGFHRPFAEIRG